MIRQARVEDAKALAEVHVRSWQVGYAHIFSSDALAGLSVARRTQGWVEWLQDDRHRTFVAEEDGEVLGFASVGPSRDEEGVGELFSIYIDPRHWRRGFGRRLITQVKSG